MTLDYPVSPARRFASLYERTPVLRILSVIVALIGSAVAAGPAQAVTGWTTPMYCSNGTIITLAPAVQVSNWRNGYDAFWSVDLYQYTTAGWVLAQRGDVWGTEVLANGGFDLGTTYGTAGPWWTHTSPLISLRTDRVSFTPARGYWYAVKHWLWDGSWTHVWARVVQNGQVGTEFCSI